jgi:GNAT superfamily N-acetyltransferase
MIEIFDFDKNHVEEAQKLAISDYSAERAVVAELPDIKDIPHLEWFAENKKGVAAYENGKMAGYLCAWGPFDNPFGGNPKIKGVWSPAHGNSAVKENKIRIYKEMYQSIAEKWVGGGALSHAVTLYAHDESATKAFFTYGFGLRCIDAVKLIETHKINNPESVLFEELPQKEAGRITELNNALSKHLGNSPCFMNYPEKTPEMTLKEAVNDNIRYFIAKRHNKIIAYLKAAGDDGEHFACGAKDMMNVCGAYLLPEYRGRGVFDALLFHTENVFAGEGYKRLGVDFESFNPTAYGFWLKYFAAYTCSVVRRTDDRAV